MRQPEEKPVSKEQFSTSLLHHMDEISAANSQSIIKRLLVFPDPAPSPRVKAPIPIPSPRASGGAIRLLDRSTQDAFNPK
jgi:hypothetical protein